MGRLKLGTPRLARALLHRPPSGDTVYIRGEPNRGKLMDELIINEVTRISDSQSVPEGFISVPEAAHLVGGLDQIMIIYPLNIFSSQGSKLKFDYQTTIRLRETYDQQPVENFFNLLVLVIGAGRTGGPMIQTLVNHGFSLLIVDKDRINPENAPFIPGADHQVSGTPKVTFWTNYLTGKYSSQKITGIHGDATREDVLQVAKGCDLIVLACDEAYVRYVYNLLAVQYRIPILDVGIGTQNRWGEDFLLEGLVRLVIPGVQGCLGCVEGLFLEQVTDEIPTGVERELMRRSGQQPETAHRPVGPLSKALAGMGANKVLEWASGHQLDPVVNIRFSDGDITADSRNPRRQRNCPICSSDLLGAGDQEPLPVGSGTRFKGVDG